MRSKAMMIAACLTIAASPQAAAQQHVELAQGKLGFDIPANFKRTDEPGFSLYIEPVSTDAEWYKCSVKILPAPTFGVDQAAANARAKQLPFARTVGSGKLIKGWYADHDGITVRALTFEDEGGALLDIRQTYLISGLFLLTIQADCIWPLGASEAEAAAGRSFLDSMRFN